MIITNNARNAKMSTWGSDESKEIILDVGAEEKSENINMKIINNESAPISNVSILGKIPTVENKIERTSGINVSKDATVYYTTAENPTADINDKNNGWSKEDNKNATHYLVQINNMENAEQLDLSYDLKIASNLTYNTSSSASYNVSYTNSKTNIESNVQSSALTLTTGTSAVLSNSGT